MHHTPHNASSQKYNAAKAISTAPTDTSFLPRAGSKGLLYLLAIAVTLSACAKMDENKDDYVSSQDRTFINTISAANDEIIDAGNLAANQSIRQPVSAFALEIVQEHTDAQKDLQEMVSGMGLTMTNGPRDAYVAQRSYLTHLPATDFDTAWLGFQINSSRAAIAMTEQEISSTTNVWLKSYATNYLMHIKQRCQTAQSMQDSL